MLSQSDRPIESVIAILARRGLEAGYLVPTATGLAKSILDAHAGLRNYFQAANFHDYENQAQGEAGRHIGNAFYVTPKGLEPTKVSFYRPISKSGDPRICLYGLKKYAQAGNLLAIFAHGKVLYVVNVSDRSMLSDAGNMHQQLARLLDQLTKGANAIANELLECLKEVARKGWIKSMRNGPTGIGYTLETHLGISANSSKAPDYKGIEIKAGRLARNRQASRTTLFSKTPIWRSSAVKNGLGLLDSYGYKADGRLQLYCSLNNHPNSLGHFLRVQDDEEFLHSMFHHGAIGVEPRNVLVWDMEHLRSALATKHRETFWVKANTRGHSSGKEEFQFCEVLHTKGPLLGNLVEMLKQGQIELDYVLHEEIGPGGKRRARDHGYLFKVWQQNLGSLFPPAQRHLLL